jgi:hypothetical protein
MRAVEKGQPTSHDDIKLESPLEQFVFNLLCDGVETNIGFGTDFFG